MMFTTKAEYGIRIMAHLAAYDGDGPLAALVRGRISGKIAAAEDAVEEYIAQR